MERFRHLTQVDVGEVRRVAVLVDARTGFGFVMADQETANVVSDATISDGQPVGAVGVHAGQVSRDPVEVSVVVKHGQSIRLGRGRIQQGAVTRGTRRINSGSRRVVIMPGYGMGHRRNRALSPCAGPHVRLSGVRVRTPGGAQLPRTVRGLRGIVYGDASRNGSLGVPTTLRQVRQPRCLGFT